MHGRAQHQSHRRSVVYSLLLITVITSCYIAIITVHFLSSNVNESTSLLQMFDNEALSYINSKFLHIDRKLDYLYKLIIKSESSTNISQDTVSLYNIENRIKFIDESYFNGILRHNYNTILMSYPASGNSLFRILLEYTTLLRTGSAYRDKDVYGSGYKGEMETGDKVFVIKMHPKDWVKNPESLRGIYMNNYNNAMNDYQKRSGKHVNLSYIFMVRNPFDVCWSYYQWEYGNKYDFNKTVFDYYIDRYNEYYNIPTSINDVKSNQFWYNNKHIKDHKQYFALNDSKLTTNYKKYVRECFNKWNKHHDMITEFNDDKSVDLFVIQMKDMFDEKKIIELLEYIFTDNYLYKEKKLESMLEYYRLFIKNIKDIPRCFFGHRQQRQNMVTKNDIYSRYDDAFLCQLYSIARDKMIHFGYTLPRDLIC